MEPTTEMRWWWRGAAPTSAVAWFAQFEGAVEDEERVDHYLLAASGRDIGVKARAGRSIDVKTLLSREERVEPVPGFAGAIERWRKWSFPLAADGPGESDLQDGSWLPVRKYRWLVLDDDCELELVEVDTADSRWWSVAVEATGADARGRQRLESGLALLAGTSPPDVVATDPDRSWGYAEHVLRITQVTRPRGDPSSSRSRQRP